MCIKYPCVGLVFAKHFVLHSVPFMYCQDVSSFGNTPVKMCHLSAGGFGSAMEATTEVLIALLCNVEMYNMQHLRMDYKHVCACASAQSHMQD